MWRAARGYLSHKQLGVRNTLQEIPLHTSARNFRQVFDQLVRSSEFASQKLNIQRLHLAANFPVQALKSQGKKGVESVEQDIEDVN